MPIFTKSIETICLERAINDSIKHYDMILKTYEESSINGDPDSMIDLYRLKSWLKKYIFWAKKWHSDNFERANDMFVDPEYGILWNAPKSAPKLKMFEDIKLENF